MGKTGLWGGCSGCWLDRKLSDGVLQLGSSLRAKKMIVLRRQISGMSLFYNLFVCVIFVGLFCYYVSNWALLVTWSR